MSELSARLAQQERARAFSIVEPQPARSPAAYYRPELDALRFFAFLCVFCFHAMDYMPFNPAIYPWRFRIGTIGAFGVPIFFLLSAFLITELLLRERERTGTIHVKAFYVRRILRIWPLYFAVFYGLTFLNHLIPGVGTHDPYAWLAFTFFAGNWYIVKHGWIASSIDPLWSISVEEQFYIAIPLLTAWGGRRVLRGTGYLLLAAAYLTVLLYALHPVPGDNGAWTNSFLQFQFFSAGSLLALLLHGRLIQLALPLRVAGFALGIVCWFTAMIRFKVQSWAPHPTLPGAFAGWLLVLAGAVLMFICTLGTPGRFVPRWLSYLGRISYGLYLFHSFIFLLVFEKLPPHLHPLFWGMHIPVAFENIVGTCAVLAATILTAHLSFRYFERPFIHLKRRFTFVPAREEAQDASVMQ